MQTVAFYHNDQGTLLQNGYEKITGENPACVRLRLGNLAQALKQRLSLPGSRSDDNGGAGDRKRST